MVCKSSPTYIQMNALQKTTYLMFKLMDFIVFLRIFTRFEFDSCNTFQQSQDRSMFTSGLHHLSF